MSLVKFHLSLNVSAVARSAALEGRKRVIGEQAPSSPTLCFGTVCAGRVTTGATKKPPARGDFLFSGIKRARRGSNLRPTAPQAVALIH